MRVLVAPDKFRGTLTARDAAQAIAIGWRRVRPDDELELVPMADGGEGTLEVLVHAGGGQIVRVRAGGPLGDPVDAPLGLIDAEDGRLAVVESATVSGLALVSEARRDPLRATSAGTGDLVLAALDRGAHRVLVCLGGSATNDGGAGMASALGVRFLDAAGRELRPGGAALLDLVRIDATGRDRRVELTQIVGATDVDNPLTGPPGASLVYGPQKGASSDDALLLDRALGHLAAVVHRDLGVSPKDEPGAGAAGGLGFGLLAFCAARLRPGIDVVMEALGLEARIARADLVLTGEGSLDAQSLRGKVPAGILRVAELAGIPIAIVCGRAEMTLPGATVVSLVDRVGAAAALGDARRSVELVAAELAGRASDLARRGARA
ncbi:MAG: glycerate kinase [Actinomycetota bacterium]|nr:glycerate kinase [Actinomycetota bacterium]